MIKSNLNSLLVALLLLIPCSVFAALPAAHNPVAGYTVSTCNSCHFSPKTYGNSNTNYGDNVCLQCHQTGVGTKKVFRPEDFADLAGTSTVTRGTPVQSSHKWFGSDNVPQAGALPPTDTGLNGLNKKTSFIGTLFCARCHNVHGTSGEHSATAPFLRAANDSDQLCTNCHRTRDKLSHTYGTHPVNVSYSAAYKAKPTMFLAEPNSGNPASQLKIVKGKVVCSTCHKVHTADSRTATLDNYTTGGAFNILSTSKGSLLRVDSRGKAANDINICTNCHTNKFAHNKNSQNVQCNDCHSGHVEYDAAANAGDTSNVQNVYLVRRYLSYSAAGRISKRIIYNDTVNKKYYIAGGGGVCQSCHAVPQATHFSGATLIRTNCAGCHVHSEATGSFSVGAGACDTCHGYPVTSNANKEPGYTGNEDTSPHITHVGGGSNYSLNCNQCHNGSVGAGATHNESPTKSYASVFIDKVAVGASGVLAGPGATYSGGTCTAVYCHSNGTSTSATGTATWAGQINTLNCGSCHASAPTTSSHSKHVATMNYGCIECHAGTVSDNTTVNIAGGKHVNAVKDIQFPVGKGTGSDCSTTYCHGNGNPVWGNTASAACGTCHNTASSTVELASGSHTKHFTQMSSVATPRHSANPVTLCGTCHDYTGETASTHVNGAPNVKTSTATSCDTCHISPYSAASVTAPAWGSSAGCAACHTAGNVITATGPATGGHTLAGHAVACTTCHSAGTTASTVPSSLHANGFINIVNVGYVSGTSVAKHTAGTGYSQCSTASCHGNPYAAGTATTPTWSGTSTGCAACHSAYPIGTNGPATGGHVLAGHQVACTACHAAGTSATTVPSTNHGDTFINVVNVGYVAGTSVAKHTAGTGYSQCSTASCHANPYAAGTATTPTWSGTSTGCNACHSSKPITATGPATGSHALAGHAVVCTTCHASGTSASTVPSVNHGDTFINVVNVGYVGGTAVAKHTSGTGYSSCNATVCHGSSSPVWGGSTTNVTCTKCHGTGTTSTITVANRDLVAPVGGNLTGTGLVSDNVKVGAHKTHLSYLNGFSNYSSNFDYRCTGCHGTLPTVGAHANGSSSPVFSSTNISTKWGAITTASYTGTTCSATYCHSPAGTTLNAANTGTTSNPSWTAAGYIAEGTKKTLTNCNTCHKVPGEVGFAGFDHGAVTIADDCAGCHSHNGITGGSIGQRHIDGKLYGAGNCDSCHDHDTVGATYTAGVWSGGAWGKNPKSVEGYGAHAKHINYIKTRLGITGALTTTGQTYGSGQPANVCGTCHSNLTANHSMGGSSQRSITFGDGATTYQYGGAPAYGGTPGVSSGTDPKTCSNLSCHYFTTPTWSTY